VIAVSWRNASRPISSNSR